jgi:K+-sensing histidine kinase KdpD
MKIQNSKRWARSGPEAYFFAVFGVFVAFSIRYSLHGFLQGNIPMTFFILNTIVIALFYGYVPSLLTIALSIPLAFFFFVPPFDSFDMPTPQDIFVFISYILIAFIAVAVVEWLQRERYRAILLSNVSNSNFQLLSEASQNLKKAQTAKSPEKGLPEGA